MAGPQVTITAVKPEIQPVPTAAINPSPSPVIDGPDPEPPPAPIPSHWEDYDSCAVLVQLKIPMILVTHPNQAIDQDGSLARTEYLRGMCSVRPVDLYRNIEVTMADPYHGNMVTRTIVPVDQIAFITRVDYR